LLLRHARPQGRSSPGTAESSFACARVTSCRAESEDRRGAGNILPTAWGQAVEGGAAPRKGERRPVMEGTSGAAERAHLRGWVRKAALSRNACGSRGRDARRRASVDERGGPWEARATVPLASSSSPDGARHGSRQEVLESIGSGPSSPRERSRWERLRRGRHCRANHATPDPWNLGWPARASEMGHPQPGTCSKGRGPGRKAAPAGDRGCGAAELGHSWSCSWIVSIAEVDRRCPASFTRVRRARGPRTLPSHPSREQRLANGSRKPAPRGQARSTVTGSHPKPGMGSVFSPERAASREHLPMEDVSGRRKQSPLTRRRWRRLSAYANG